VLKSFVGFVCLLGLIGFFIVVAASVAALGASIWIVTPNLINSFDYPFFIALPYPPFLFTLPILIGGVPWAVYFVLIVLAIMISFGYMLGKEGKHAARAVCRALSSLRGLPRNTTNSFFIIAQLFLAVFFFIYAYYFIIELMGIHPHIPESIRKPVIWELMFELANASVYEELITRLLIIGVPLLGIDILMQRKRERAVKYLLGGGFELNLPTAFLIVFSSALFGLAHISGWDYYKVIPTFISGLAFGYLFVVKGLHAAIVLHFAFDYMNVPLILMGYPLTLVLLFTFLIILWLFVGMVYFAHYLKSTFLFIRKSCYKYPEVISSGL
jgi:hypothetical protein